MFARRPLAPLLAILSTLAPASAVAAAEAAPPSTAAELLTSSDYAGGVIVYLGRIDLADPFRWPQLDRSLVLLLDTDLDRVEAFRRSAAQHERYGTVLADTWDGKHIPLVDRLANRILVDSSADMDRDELLRVLAPRGTAWLQRGEDWNPITKAMPDTIDEWTHYFHDASGNAVAHDTEVAPPRHLQWLGSPRWSRHHDRMASMSALVSSGGRIFYIVDEGSRASIQLPAHWKLVARDAFNGVILWKRPIAHWHNHLWPLKSGPTQLARRLVADGSRIFVTLGLRAPVTAIDAVSGKTLHTYARTEGTEEIVHHQGTLFLLVNRGESELERYFPLNNVGDQRRVAQEWHWNERPRMVMAVDAESGKTLWQMETKVAPFSLAVGETDVVFHNGTELVSLDRQNGHRRWAVPASRRPRITMNFGPRVVLHEDVVLYAGGDRKMAGFDRASGKKLWEAEHPPGSYESPEDLLVVGGLVWSAPTRFTRDSGVFAGRDPRTGEIKIEFPPDVETYWFHHRCYMAKATDRFLLPSRTGIEFVDPDKRSWNINHWVRGGCLYGVMPSNGLLYAPPHDCACYPETKLWGLNALAAHSPTRMQAAKPGPGRLTRGPAYASQPRSTGRADNANDWPTYRGTSARHGHTDSSVDADLRPRWEARLPGRLTAPTVAGGVVYVAQIDRHTLHALDAQTGKPRWSFTAGGRIDSPPTCAGGRIYFGSADGHVYCLTADTGELVWRFRAAPHDLRLVALEQIESVWPVHGSVLVDGDVFFLAGRSTFLDGGLRFFRLDAATGALKKETVLDEVDETTGKPLQAADFIKILNMPVGLPDILSSDSRYIYMRSQRLDRNGKRLETAPVSGDPVETGAAQRGEGVHLFAPLGFVDDSWFHRGYWVWGRHFAGGHAGYYQAGRFTPSGRLLTVDDQHVFGFARKPQYYRWTTILEHHLYCAAKAPPEVAPEARRSRRRGVAHVAVNKSASLDPAKKDVVVEAWVYAERPTGTVIAHGGSQYGYALDFRQGRPRFLVRVDGDLTIVSARDPATRRWAHLVAALGKDGRIALYVDGKLVAKGECKTPLRQPSESLQIGADLKSTVGNYRAPNGFGGVIDEVGIYHGKVAVDEPARRFQNPHHRWQHAHPVLHLSFSGGQPKDDSGNNNHGTNQGAIAVKGERGQALRFRNRPGRGNTNYVRFQWTRDLPIFVEAMVSAGDRLIVAGPPDLIDEEKTFQRLTRKDATVETELRAQDEAWQGRLGSRVLVISKRDGKTLQTLKLPALVRWDGMAVAEKCVFVTTTDGVVYCLAGRSSSKP